MEAKKQPTYFQSILPFLAMLFCIVVGYVILGLRIELMLTASAAVAGVIAWRLGYSWDDIQEAICVRMKRITPSVLIMWSVGVVIGTFMFAGSIPIMIYYGLMIVNPAFLVPFSFLICLLLSSVTGTSWGSAGTAGVAMIGISIGLGVPVPITAGAVISGAIFGDKMSPLSDTTNLCPACTGGVTLYEHIRHMWYTTLPSAIIALILFTIVGLNVTTNADVSVEATESMIEGFGNIYNFHGINIFLMLIPLLIVLGGAFIRKPTVPTMLLGSLCAVIIGMICNGFALQDGSLSAITGFKASMAVDPEILDANVQTLVNRGGMHSMIGIISIIYTGYAFTAVWSLTGGIQVMFAPMIGKIKSGASAIVFAIITTFLLDGSCGTSYVPSIVVPELYRKTFIEKGLHLKNLSRILEDAGTCLNPIWPWSMSGIYFATTLGVGTLEYLPYAFFCIVAPFVAIVSGITGFGVQKLTPEEQEAELKRIESEV